jgi:hypothetical protein
MIADAKKNTAKAMKPPGPHPWPFPRKVKGNNSLLSPFGIPKGRGFIREVGREGSNADKRRCGKPANVTIDRRARCASDAAREQ